MNKNTRSLDYFVHPNALCETVHVGKDTRIWAFAHILPGAKLGEDCNICDGVFIENDVKIGNRVTIKNGVQLWDGIEIDDDVFIGPNATFTNDPFPRSRQIPDKFSRTHVCKKASIGANATILPGIRIGENAMVGAGAVVTKSIVPNAIVIGNPARIVGYVEGQQENPHQNPSVESAHDQPANEPTSVQGVYIQEFPLIREPRGDLVVGQHRDHIPFQPMRFFTVMNVPEGEVRGQHAHQRCEQFLVCLKGSCALVVEDGQNTEEIILDRPNMGVYLPPLTWGIQHQFSPDAILLVLASDVYDVDGYINDYEEFLHIKQLFQR